MMLVDAFPHTNGLKIECEAKECMITGRPVSDNEPARIETKAILHGALQTFLVQNGYKPSDDIEFNATGEIDSTFIQRFDLL